MNFLIKTCLFLCFKNALKKFDFFFPLIQINIFVLFFYVIKSGIGSQNFEFFKKKSDYRPHIKLRHWLIAHSGRRLLGLAWQPDPKFFSQKMMLGCWVLLPQWPNSVGFDYPAKPNTLIFFLFLLFNFFSYGKEK